MKRLIGWLKKFFFPPVGTPLWQRILPYAVLGVLTLAVLVASAYGWEYTNSPAFCGKSCHTMPPEFNSYLESPHARISCVECHIGRGFIATQITRKAGDLKHVLFLFTKKYEFPITADEMRPATDTCERCHFPQKFSDDSLRQTIRYQSDKDNTPTTLYLVLKTGGGSTRAGQSMGIHWHIANRILYYPGDKSEQTIPYIRVYNDDGTVQEYADITSGIAPEIVNEADLKEMDCITCHNRITHLVKTPEDSVDVALTRKMIDSAIPEIRLKSVEVMRARYETQDQAIEGIAGLENYYRVVYPDYYTANREKIQAAITVLQDIYEQSVFLEQKSDWNSHPDNIGHKDFPGCFRCHDGKHLDENQNAIRLECNLCHSIPVVAGAQDFLTQIEISRGPEPDSHFHANWISMHSKVLDQTCSNCHDTSDPGGTSNTSFCSNSACHGSVWTFAGFNAPALKAVIDKQLPPTPTPMAPEDAILTYNGSIGSLLTTRCGSCHGANGLQGLDVTSYAGLMTGGKSGAAITPGDVENSLLIKVQTGEKAHFAQFSAEEIDLISKWIQIGAPEK